MILVDLNQVMISNLMMQIGGKKNIQIQEDLVRHMVLNSLRMYRQKFSKKYGELVICCDDKNYWRREIYPYYKIHRKKDREESGLDWNMIFTVLNSIRDDIRSDFPYKVIQVPHAEADDIIGTLCNRFGHLGIMNNSAEPILILSSDKDFAQLQKYANVEQYSPMGKKYVTCSNPARYLYTNTFSEAIGAMVFLTFYQPMMCLLQENVRHHSLLKRLICGMAKILKNSVMNVCYVTIVEINSWLI